MWIYVIASGKMGWVTQGKRMNILEQQDDTLAATRELISKGRLVEAAHGLIQHLTARPDCLEARDLLENTLRDMGQPELIERYLGKRPAKGPAGRRRFCFLIVPLMHGGSRFLQQALALHPDLYVPHVYATDKAIELKSEREFLDKHQNLMRGKASFRVGLVLHEYGSCKGTNIEPPSLEETRRLSEIVEGDRFIQVVRDPMSYVKSMLRHYMGEVYGWNFAKIGLSCLDGYDLLGGANTAPSDERAKLSLPDYGGLHDRVLHFLTVNLQYMTNADRYRRYFPDWEAFDLSEFRSGANGPALERLFSLLGADPSFRHASFDRAMHSQVHLSMRGNALTALAGDFEIPLRLGFEGEGLAEDRPGSELVELAKTTVPADCRVAELRGHTLCLFAFTAYWNNLPLKVRNHLIEGGYLDDFLNGVLVRWFISNFIIVRGKQDAIFPDQPPLSLRQTLWERAGADLTAYAEAQPQVAAHWQDPQEAFTQN